MNKKISSIFFLLIIFVSITLAYVYFTQPAADEQNYSGSVEDVDDDQLSDEIDDTFLEEDDEIEIGEMV